MAELKSVFDHTKFQTNNVYDFLFVIFSSMPYIEALVLESVRVFMGRTFSIPHRALRDCTVQGYYIPKVLL